MDCVIGIFFTTTAHSSSSSTINVLGLLQYLPVDKGQTVKVRKVVKGGTLKVQTQQVGHNDRRHCWYHKQGYWQCKILTGI